MHRIFLWWRQINSNCSREMELCPGLMILPLLFDILWWLHMAFIQHCCREPFCDGGKFVPEKWNLPKLCSTLYPFLDIMVERHDHDRIMISAFERLPTFSFTTITESGNHGWWQRNCGWCQQRQHRANYCFDHQEDYPLLSSSWLCFHLWWRYMKWVTGSVRMINRCTMMP